MLSIFYIPAMNLFYTTDIQGDLIFLTEAEARHAVQVLRMQEGDSISVIDGQGGWYEGTIVETGKRRCVARIDEKRQEVNQRPYRVHLAIAPTKNINRFEWCLEKATEIGVDEITPLLCFHSERRHLRADRLEKVLIAAMKQSLKASLPHLNELTKIDEFLSRTRENQQQFIAYLGEEVKEHLKDNYLPGENVTILIGPEGDFSEGEIETARQQGFTGVTLGKSRLRTETAGIVACHIVQLMNE